MTGVAAGSPSRIAEASTETSSGVKPDRAAEVGLIWNVTAGPLIASSTPLSISTTPGTLLIASATRGPVSFSNLPSCEYKRIDDRLGLIA